MSELHSILTIYVALKSKTLSLKIKHLMHWLTVTDLKFFLHQLLNGQLKYMADVNVHLEIKVVKRNIKWNAYIQESCKQFTIPKCEKSRF